MSTSTITKSIGLILLVLSGTFLVFWTIDQFQKQSYRQYLEQDAAVHPLYVQLNLEIFNQIPVPDGVLEINRSSSYGHGSRLMVVYKLTNTTIAAVFAHYDQFLATNKWIRLLSTEERKNYARATSCFAIYYYGVPNLYDITIEHEYFKQDFTPKMPPDWIMFLHEGGEIHFSGCSALSIAK
jgi:hypothetical protein